MERLESGVQRILVLPEGAASTEQGEEPQPVATPRCAVSVKGWTQRGPLLRGSRVILALWVLALVTGAIVSLHQPSKRAARAGIRVDPSTVPAARVVDEAELPAPAAEATWFTRPEPQAVGNARRHGAGAGSSLSAELSVLSRATDALLRRDTSTARDALAEHRRRFRSPQLAEEREGLSVLAACMEQNSAAKPKALAFVQGRPRSVLALHVKRACGLADDT